MLAVRMLLFPNLCLPLLKVAEMAECIGSALIQKGFKPCSEQFIGIFSQNRPEVLTEPLAVLASPCFPPAADGDWASFSDFCWVYGFVVCLRKFQS